MLSIPATQFKARCLAILDEVAATGQSVTITKRGKPVAQLGPPAPRAGGYPQHQLMGTVVYHGDVLAPVVPPEAWDAERGELL